MRWEQFHISSEGQIVLLILYSILVGYLIGSSVEASSNLSLMKIDGIDSSIYGSYKAQKIPEIHVETNPRGAERLPPGIVEAHSDYSTVRGCVGNDTVNESRYLLALTVGIKQKELVNKIVSKFPAENFTTILFHYDGNTSDWDQFEWSDRVLHVSTLEQTKWWYAKRFLHPDIVFPYDYIFIWDEDLGVDHFNSLEYIKIVKKYGLEISQPGITSDRGVTYEMTRKLDNVEVHRRVTKDMELCVNNSSMPPCAGFVEIMAPVFTRKSWNCVWHMIQNDLVHGWGLDFSFWRCFSEKPEEKIGVVDSQWIQHLGVPSLVAQGNSSSGFTQATSSSAGKRPVIGVRQRSWIEWKEFEKRMNSRKSS